MDRRAFMLAAAGLAVAPGFASGSDAPMTLLTRPIPSSGEALPVVGLGTWQAFDVAPGSAEYAAAREALRTFSALGGKVVDSSPMYDPAEAVLGSLSAELGLRDRLFIATKVWTQGRAAGIREMETSFKLLRVERIDLMQVHNLLDTDTHWGTLAAWQRDGRIRYLGVTHYHAGAFAAVEAALKKHRPQFVQINYSLAEPEAGDRLLDVARGEGVAVIVNRPFAGSALFGKVRGQAVPPWAAEFGCASWAQFFLKWILGNPAVTCTIPGTRDVRHVTDNLGAATGPLPDATQRKRMQQHFAAL
jgi:aryl-alcohol dehydrogenase-like predicted oxidoreductase